MSDGYPKVPVVRLGELLVDSCYGTSQRSSPDGLTPIVGIPHVHSGRVELDTRSRVDLPEDERRKLTLRSGDILLIRTNGNRAVVGQTGVVTGESDAVFASYLVRLRVDSERLEPRYLNYWMNSPAGRRQVRRVITEAGQANVNPTELRKLVRVPLPSVSKQRQIASSISVCDQAAYATRQLLRSKYSQCDWIARDLLERRRIPGSCRTTLGAIARIRSGNTPSKSNPDFWNGDHPWVSASDLKTLVVSDSVERLSDAGYAEASVAPRNSLLVLTRGMTLFNNVPVCIAGQEVAFNQDVKALVIEAETNAEYVAFLLRVRKNDLLGLVDTAGHGTGRLDTQALREFPVLLPPRDHQDEIIETLRTAYREIEVLQRLGAAYEDQKRALMSVLFPNESADS